MSARLGQVALVLLSLGARLIFLAYRILATGLVSALVVGPIYLAASRWCPAGASDAQAQSYGWWGYAALTLLLLCLTYRRHPGQENPYRRYVGLTGWLDKLVDRFIAWIGTLKYFTSPLSLVEDPGSYKIKGDEIRTLIDGGLQPGDILLRGYDGYLDGLMISISGGGGGIKRHFSHAALYLGDLNDGSDKAIVARRLEVMDEQGRWKEATLAEKDRVRNDTAYYEPGRQRVVHSMARGVFTEDILTFLRCDYLVVLRLPAQIQLDADDMEQDRSLVRELAADADAIRRGLMQGQPVARADVVAAVHRSALGKIGSCYDFQFNDGKRHNRFSCSEFVYYCYKSIHCYLGLQLKKRAFMGFLFPRLTITPGDIYDAAVLRGKLEVVWTSRSLK
jgi:hypothetical protein